jgi:hypothetical protein
MSAAPLPRRAATPLRDRFGPVALVTGASDGIGRAFAAALAAEGFDLILAARRRPALAALAEDLAARHGVSVEVVAADLGTEAGLAELLAATEGRDIGLLVAAAGFGTSGRFVEAELATELDMLAVNVRAPLVLAHALGRRFVARGGGGIVLFGSILGFQGVAGSANYAATKAYAQTLAEGLGPELAPFGVRVVAAAPGPIRSGFAARAGMVMGLAGAPEAVARDALGLLARGRGGTVRPGLVSKALGWSLATLPRGLRSAVLGRIMAGMTAPQ